MAGKAYRFSSSASWDQRPADRIRQRVVIALRDTVFLAWLARRLRGLGWVVYSTQSGDQARQLCRQYSPQVAVLDTGLEDQSGWLTCEKIVREDPTVKVILLALRPEANSAAFADFVGKAKLIHQEDGIQAIINEVVGTTALVGS
jgi:ActR/RegA family two-component response regulator